MAMNAQSYSSPERQQLSHSISKEFPPALESLSQPQTQSNRDIPSLPVNQFESEPEFYEEQEDDNDDFFNGSSANQNGGLHPNSSYNPALGDYRGPVPVSTQSVRSSSPPPAGPILDHSHLRPGNQASLLSHERTLELYRANAKKTQDPDLQFEFAVFMIDASKSMPIPAQTLGNVMEVERAVERREDLIREATSLLKRLADRGHPQSQYFLADCYANGIGTFKNKQDFDCAYSLFVLAAKHNHADAAYRAGTCCENGYAYRLGECYEYGKMGCPQNPALSIHYYVRLAFALF